MKLGLKEENLMLRLLLNNAEHRETFWQGEAERAQARARKAEQEASDLWDAIEDARERVLGLFLPDVPSR